MKIRGGIIGMSEKEKMKKLINKLCNENAESEKKIEAELVIKDPKSFPQYSK